MCVRASVQVTLGGVPIKDSPFAMVADRQDLVKLRPEWTPSGAAPQCPPAGKEHLARASADR
jgi:hypothetical protein